MSIFQDISSELAAHGSGDVAGLDKAGVTLILTPYVDVPRETTKWFLGLGDE